MLRQLSVRATPITTRAAEYAPVAGTCCNICRTCTTTNVVGLAIGGASFAAVGFARFARRLVRR